MIKHAMLPQGYQRIAAPWWITEVMVPADSIWLSRMCMWITSSPDTSYLSHEV